MPVQIQIPIDKAAKKLKKLVSEVALVVRENGVYLLAIDDAQTLAVYLRVGENIGEEPQQIIIDVSELAKLEAIRSDVDIGEDGMLNITSITKSGIQVEKKIASYSGEKPIDLVEELLGKEASAYLVARASELKDLLEQVMDESNEARLIIKDNVVVAEASGIAEKVRKITASFKPEELSGNAELKVNADVLYAIIDALSTLSGKLRIEITSDNLIKIKADVLEAYGLLSSLAE